MIIGLEGVSCVGKTTLAAALSARLPATSVACYYHAAPDLSWLPEPAAATAAQQVDNLAMLMRIEALRRASVLAALAQGHDVILDRTVDTLLAHAHAVGRLHGFDCDDQARAVVLAHPRVVPDITLLLHADPAEVTARAARRIGMPTIFYAPEFTAHFHDYFARPLAPRCVRLDSTRGPDEVAERAVAVLAGHRLVEERTAA